MPRLLEHFSDSSFRENFEESIEEQRKILEQQVSDARKMVEEKKRDYYNKSEKRKDAQKEYDDAKGYKKTLKIGKLTVSRHAEYNAKTEYRSTKKMLKDLEEQLDEFNQKNQSDSNNEQQENKSDSNNEQQQENNRTKREMERRILYLEKELNKCVNDTNNTRLEDIEKLKDLLDKIKKEKEKFGSFDEASINDTIENYRYFNKALVNVNKKIENENNKLNKSIKENFDDSETSLMTRDRMLQLSQERNIYKQKIIYTLISLIITLFASVAVVYSFYRKK